MSSPEICPRPSSTRARITALTLVLGASLMAGGCGFQPLYGSGPVTASAATELASVEIVPVRRRIAQQIRNHLISTMSPPGTAAPALYRLQFVPTESTRNVFVQANSDVTRHNYTLNAQYVLFDNATNAVLRRGNAFSIVSYDRVESEFANIRARKSATEQAARSVADDIRTDLAAYFAAR